METIFQKSKERTEVIEEMQYLDFINLCLNYKKLKN